MNNQDRQVKYVEEFVSTLQEAAILNVNTTDVSAVSFGVIPGNPSLNFALVTMTNEHLKSSIYSQRTKLKGLSSKVFINEDLTKPDASISRKQGMMLRPGN
jgi:hypothetical protein